ncbi:MAG: hypothetical protein KDC38_05065 [Planctomycetes bacterium]|nr:hypothetical protein [Planctomycetota bacterium]
MSSALSSRRCLRFGFIVIVGLASACGGGGGGGGAGVPAPSTDVDPGYDFGRNRDVTTGDVLPVLAETGSGFDANEVDSPAIADDATRPAGDRHLLYYEASDASGNSTIGVVSSDEEDFATLTISGVQVVPLGGVGSGYDFGATDPSVVVDTSVPFGTVGRYRMWFEGRSGTGGIVSQIVTASSGDGVTWSGFTLCSGLVANFAATRVADPCVVRDGATFRMWFEGIDGSSSVIGYAESADGFAWTVRDAAGTTGATADPVFIEGSAGSFDAAGVHAPAVVRDPSVTPGSPGAWLLFYEASDTLAATENTLGVASSSDGLTWSDPTLPVLRPSSDSIVPLPFDSGDLEHPSVRIDPGVPVSEQGFILLYYTGDGENGVTPNRIGLARGALVIP